MAYQEVDMWEVLEVLRRAARGESITQIKQATGRSRKTVRRYVRLARKLGWAGDQEPTEDLAGAVQRRLKPVPEESAPGVAESRLWPHRERIRLWLEGNGYERGLRLTKVHLLLNRQGVQVPYSSLHRFVVKHCGFADRRRLTVRRAPCAPGELAEIDFGRLGLVWDPAVERRRYLYALIVTLGYSRHMYVHVTTSQQYEDLIDGLENAWSFLGGVVRRVVLDNLKAAIFKADRYDPIFQRTFSEYAHYRGFVIDPAVPRDPTGKPIVERAVQYVRENFFRGETWLDPWQVRGDAVRWCVETAGTRIHGTTQKRPLAVFENVEKPALRPLDKPRFVVPQWSQCTVHGDHHISVGKALYSVPTHWLGHKVWVRADSKLVRIYADGQLVKTHSRLDPGGRSTDYDDYPKEKTPYALRDPQRLIHAAGQHGEHLGRFMEQLLRGDFPWAKLRQGQKLLRLCDKYGAKCVDQACSRALAFDLINVRRVESIIRQHLEQAPQLLCCRLLPPSCRCASLVTPEASFIPNPKEIIVTEVKQSLKSVLKRLRLSGVLATLPDRTAYARKAALPELDFMELVLQDEIDRREHKSLELRLARAGFEEEQTFENFDWNTPVSFDRQRVKDLIGLGFIDRREDVILLGPVGVGKTCLASALGHSACRAGYDVLFLRADQMLRHIHQARADHSNERFLRRLLAPDLLIIDDFGLRRLDPLQSSDFYDVVIERHRRASTIVTSNRTLEEWVGLFDDPILAQSALDRLAHNAHQIVIEGDSCRSHQRPGANPENDPTRTGPKPRGLESRRRRVVVRSH